MSTNEFIADFNQYKIDNDLKLNEIFEKYETILETLKSNHNKKNKINSYEFNYNTNPKPSDRKIEIKSIYTYLMKTFDSEFDSDLHYYFNIAFFLFMAVIQLLSLIGVSAIMSLGAFIYYIDHSYFKIHESLLEYPVVTIAVCILLYLICICKTYSEAREMFVDLILLNRIHAENVLAYRVSLTVLSIRTISFLYLMTYMYTFAVIGYSGNVLDCLLNTTGILTILDADNYVYQSMVEDSLEVHIPEDAFHFYSHLELISIFFASVGSTIYIIFNYNTNWYFPLIQTFNEILLLTPIKFYHAYCTYYIDGYYSKLFYYLNGFIFIYFSVAYYFSYFLDSFEYISSNDRFASSSEMSVILSIMTIFQISTDIIANIVSWYYIYYYDYSIEDTIINVSDHYSKTSKYEYKHSKNYRYNENKIYIIKDEEIEKNLELENIEEIEI